MTRTLSGLLIALLALAVSLPAAAGGGIEITPYVGYAFGGEVTDYWTGDRYRLKDSENFGISLDIAVDPDDDTWIQLRWNHQESELRTTIPELGTLGIDLDYFHIGGVREFEGQNQNVIPYGMGTLGATHFNPETPGLSSATRFSLSLGGGVKLMSPGGRVGVRLEGRLLGSYFDSSAAFFCGAPGGCAFGISGNMLFQGEVSVGLILAMGR
jgi:hypothetical protein